MRLADVEALALASEPVTYKGDVDPCWNLRAAGATEAECDFLVREPGPRGWLGPRVEINAMTSPQLVTWLDQKLAGHGVTKVVPDTDILDAAYRRARGLARIERAIATRSTAAATSAIGSRTPSSRRSTKRRGSAASWWSARSTLRSETSWRAFAA